MNLYGFRIHTPWPNVEVWEWRRTRLTFLTVLTNRIVSMVRGTAQSTDTDCTLHLVSSYVERFRPVAFRNPSGVVTHVPAGQVMTTSLSDTLDFLLNRAVPYGDGLIDRYLREATAGTLTPAQLRERLGTLLWHGGRSCGFADCRSGGGTRLSRQLLDDAPITWYRTDAPWPFAAAVSIKHLDGPHLFPVHRWRYFVCPVEVPFADGVLPRTAWLRVDEQQQLRGWWDGSRAHGRTAWDDLPDALRRQLAQHGTVLPLERDCSRPIQIPFPEESLEALFLLRVPRDLAGLTEPARRPRHPALRNAAFLLDPRWPIQLHDPSKRLPVIEDPSTVRWILHRTTAEGFFVPNMPPLQKPTVLAPGRTLVGTLPGRSPLPRVKS